jgi:hypothetical protein
VAGSIRNEATGTAGGAEAAPADGVAPDAASSDGLGDASSFEPGVGEGVTRPPGDACGRNPDETGFDDPRGVADGAAFEGAAAAADDDGETDAEGSPDAEPGASAPGAGEPGAGDGGTTIVTAG